MLLVVSILVIELFPPQIRPYSVKGLKIFFDLESAERVGNPHERSEGKQSHIWQKEKILQEKVNVNVDIYRQLIS